MEPRLVELKAARVVVPAAVGALEPVAVVALGLAVPEVVVVSAAVVALGLAVPEVVVGPAVVARAGVVGPAAGVVGPAAGVVGPAVVAPAATAVATATVTAVVTATVVATVAVVVTAAAVATVGGSLSKACGRTGEEGPGNTPVLFSFRRQPAHQSSFNRVPCQQGGDLRPAALQDRGGGG